MRLDLHVRIVPDETLAGTMIAHIDELDVSTPLREGEDPFPVLTELVRGTFQMLEKLGRLNETLEGLTKAKVLTPPDELIADFHLSRRHSIAL